MKKIGTKLQTKIKEVRIVKKKKLLKTCAENKFHFSF